MGSQSGPGTSASIATGVPGKLIGLQIQATIMNPDLPTPSPGTAATEKQHLLYCWHTALTPPDHKHLAWHALEQRYKPIPH